MTGLLVLVANPGDATISAFRLDGDRLERLATTGLPGPSSAFAVDLARDLVYAAVKATPPALVTLRLDRTSGVLTEVGRIDVEAGLTYVDLAHDGRVLLGASYGGGSGYAWPVDEGVVGAVASRIAFPNLHCVVSSTGGHAYFVSLGADLVAQYTVSDAGVLTPLEPETLAAPPGSGPRHLALDADQANAYLVTEYSGELIRFARDAASGLLSRREAVSVVEPDAGLAHSRLGADPVAGHLIWGADVHVAEGVVVASERSASTLATVPLEADGRLGDAVVFTATEPQPRGFAVTPDGSRVLAVGERSTMLALSRIAPDGTLTLLDRVETGRGANWVRVVPA